MNKFISIARTRTTLKACALFVFTAALAASFTGMLRGSMPDVQTGTWTVTGNLDGVRAGAAAALLPDGRVLVTGGSDGTASIDTVQVYGSDGGFSGAASMTSARADHTATVLADGSVLVVGGRNTEGAVASAEIFLNGTWFAGGALTDARWGHTATLLADGRVLIAGGENGAGPLASFEIFDPATGQVSAAGSLATARRGHAAARLADGRVIIAGGESLDGALDSTEFIDPASSSVSPGPALGSKRVGLSATTLLDGKVLFLGGNNGTSNLASAELFNAATGALAATASAAVARRDHQAFLLPNNNAVLIVGGIADIVDNGTPVTAPTATAELFLPWLQQVWPTGSMSSARVKAIGSALSTQAYGGGSAGDGLLMVAGGESASGSEAYRFASIRTDKDDYAPGDIVYVSGTGWQPNESVTFGVRELPAEHETRSFTLAVDDTGRITNVQLFTVEPHHLNVTFFVTARGAASQAQVTFTDGNVKVGINPSNVTATITATLYSSGGCTGTSTPKSAPGTVGVGSAESLRLDAAATGTASVAPINRVFVDWTVESGAPFTVIPGTSGRSICVSGDFSGSKDATANYVGATSELTATKSNTVSGSTTFPTGWTWAIDVANTGNAPGTFNSAGLVVRDELPTSGLTYGSPNVVNQTSVSGPLNCLISSNTLICSANSGTVTIGAGGSFRVQFTATPSAAATYANPRSGGVCKVDPNSLVTETTEGNNDCANTVTVGKASQTITFDPLINRTYGDAPFTVSATGDGSGNAVTFALGAGSVGCTVVGSTVTIVSATGVDEFCIIVASQAGNANYNAAGDVTRSFMIAKATPTVAVTWTGGTYNGAPWPATASVTGVGSPAAVLTTPATTFTYYSGPTATGTALAGPPTNAGTYTVRASYAGDSNYNAAEDDETITIAKATATVAVTPYSVTYDGQPHTASYTITGVNGESGATVGTVDVSNTTHTTAGTYATDTWSFTGTANYNNIGATTITDEIAKATATVVVTPYSVTYDGQPHTASYTITGVNGESGATVGTVDVSNTTHTTAGTYATDTWSFTGTANYNNIGATTITDEIAKATATVAVTPYSVTYDGQPHTASYTITGVNGESGATVGTVDVSNTTHTTAGTYATDTWSFTGTANYNNIGATTITDEIAKATATVVVTPYSVTYDGQPHTASYTITGVNGESGATVGTVDVSNTTHTTAGTYATDTWSFTGTANYNNIGATTITDEIAKATATVAVTPYSVTYDGQPHTASYTITGVNGESGATVGTVDVSNTTHTTAGTYATDTWSFTGTANYNNIGATTITDEIAKATATVAVTPYSVTYDGQPHTASYTITGVNGESGATVGTVDVSNTTHTTAGTYATDTWSFTGTANYNNIGATTITDEIAKATATVVVNGFTGVYDGNPHGATGTAKGVQAETLAGLDLGPSFTNVPGGTASWTFTDVTGNYNNATGTAEIVISKANATINVTGYTGVYDGLPHGATGTAVGIEATPADLNALLHLGSSFTNVPGGTATWTFDGNGNYNTATGTAGIVITTRAATVVVDIKTKLLNAPNPTLTGTLTNFVAADNISATYSTTATQSSPVGSYPITATLVDPNGKLANYTITNTPGTLKILFLWDGFLQPINDTAHDQHLASPISKFKLGQTIPVKFDLKDANGNIVVQTGSPLFNRALVSSGCAVATEDEPTTSLPADSMPIYTLNGGHYQYGWSTKGLAAGLYRIYANLADGTSQSVLICLNK